MDSSQDLEALEQSQLPPLIAAEEHANVKVMVINFDPIVDGNQRLSFVRQSIGSAALVQQFRESMYGASHGGISYDIVDWADEGFPRQSNGQLPTYQEHIACLNKGEQCYNYQFADYAAIADKHNLCGRVANQDVDEVWLFGDTGFGFFESIMVGKGAFEVNSNPLWTWKIFACPRPFIIMGFNYTRGVAQMLHNFGHRVDSVILHTKDTRPSVNKKMADIFVREMAPDRLAGCGTTHRPPNVTDDREYFYGLSDPSVVSECDKVGPAQSSSSPTRILNCQEWGCYELGYHVWRFGKLPRTLATNWWREIFSTVEFMPGQAAF